MGWSIKIARIAGTEIKIHLTFFLLLAWIGLVYYLQGGPGAAVEGVIFIILLFGCVLLHEFGHALAARRYGIPTPDITLLPIGGVARLQRIPDKPRQELVVALAGPAVNVVIAFLLFLWLGRAASLEELTRLESPQLNMAAKLMAVNVWLVLFNLIPAFPMDGGRVLRALLAMRMNYAQATQIAASIGQGIAFLFGFLGLFFNPLLIFIALFIYLGASQEAALAQMRDVARSLPVSAAMVTEFKTLPPSATLNDAIDLLLRTSQHEFPVVDATGRVHGILTRDALLTALRQNGPDTPVREALQGQGELPLVSWRAPFDAAFQEMQACGCPALPVVDDYGRLVGLITPENVGELMMVQSALKKNERLAWRPADG
ncbi:MAG: site-2 protease family protein [Caldilinea sp.]|nr:site-2 protease family protein [Caldilinea sp.]MDW8442717.1 site-2 protease family protein [Caldilineaceae bacterium]